MNQENETVFTEKDIIFVYTRKQGVEDGVLIQAPEGLVKDAGIKYPVYLTRLVYSEYVEIPEGVTGQDEIGRLWDILYMFSIKARMTPGDTLTYQILVRNTNGKPRLVTLQAKIGATDIDDPRPAITIMKPDED